MSVKFNGDAISVWSRFGDNPRDGMGVGYVESDDCSLSDQSLLDRIASLLKSQPAAGQQFPIALGDYEDPGGDIAKTKARQLFWDAFAVEAPVALRELVDVDGMRKANASDDFHGWILRHCRWWCVRYGISCSGTDSSGLGNDAIRLLGMYLVEKIREDGEPVGDYFDLGRELPDRLTVDAFDVALAYEDHTLSPRLARSRKGNTDSDVSTYHFDIDDPLDISLQEEHGEPFMGWNPVFETRTAAKARHMATFERLLDEALNEREHEAQMRGLVKVRTTKRTTDHFRWLVRYQCLGQNYDAIAREARKDRATVREGVAAAAALLGLTIRKPIRRGGRPRKRRARTIRWTRHTGG